MKLCAGFLFVSMLLAFNCHAGETWYITDWNQFGCISRNDLRDLLKYLDQNDSEALVKKMERKECFPLAGHMEVHVRQRYEPENMVKIRIRGQIQEIWVPSYAITNEKPR